MGTISNKIEYLEGTKDAIRTAIESKGIAVSDTDTFRSYATKISQIDGGSSLTFDAIYPVGSIYMSVGTTSPSVLFGGTWEKIEDTFLLACGSTFALGQTGGEVNHILTIGEMPTHNHDMYSYNDAGDGTIGTGHGVISDIDAPYKTYWAKLAMENAGSSQPHNNMPPYLAVNIWKRTA